MPNADRTTNQSIAVQVTKWSNLLGVDEIPKISDADIECLNEVRAVLKKHNQLERFGISLLHKHFDIAEDEFLLETTDVTERTQLIRPAKLKDFEDRDDVTLIATCIKLVEGNELMVACTKCNATHGHHPMVHPDL